MHKLGAAAPRYLLLGRTSHVMTKRKRGKYKMCTKREAAHIKIHRLRLYALKAYPFGQRIWGLG